MIASPSMTAVAHATPAPAEPASAETLARRVDEAKAAASALGDAPKAALAAYADALEAFHARALRTIVAALKADPRGKELLFALVDDPVVIASMLALGVVKPDLTTRVAHALERVRPYAKSHGGDVELVRVEGTVAFVRLHGACSGCSMSAQTVAEGVERAIAAEVPQIERVEQVRDTPAAGFIPLTVGATAPDWPAPGWSRGPATLDVPIGRPVRMLNDGCDVLVVRHGDRFFAYRNACPHQGMPLDDAHLSHEGTLTCPWHGLEFDACSGECKNEPLVQLDPLPLRIVEGHVWVNTNPRHA